MDQVAAESVDLSAVLNAGQVPNLDEFAAFNIYFDALVPASQLQHDAPDFCRRDLRGPVSKRVAASYLHQKAVFIYSLLEKELAAYPWTSGEAFFLEIVSTTSDEGEKIADEAHERKPTLEVDTGVSPYTELCAHKKIEEVAAEGQQPSDICQRVPTAVAGGPGDRLPIPASLSEGTTAVSVSSTRRSSLGGNNDDSWPNKLVDASGLQVLEKVSPRVVLNNKGDVESIPHCTAPINKSGAAVSSYGTGDDDIPHLEGRIRIADNTEEAWLIVHLMRRISESMPDASIALWDIDGNFLLIEAAMTLPSWLTPQAAVNRVWLRQGSLSIIPQTPPRPLNAVSSQTSNIHNRIPGSFVCPSSSISSNSLSSKINTPSSLGEHYDGQHKADNRFQPQSDKDQTLSLIEALAALIVDDNMGHFKARPATQKTIHRRAAPFAQILADNISHSCRRPAASIPQSVPKAFPAKASVPKGFAPSISRPLIEELPEGQAKTPTPLPPPSSYCSASSSADGAARHCPTSLCRTHQCRLVVPIPIALLLRRYPLLLGVALDHLPPPANLLKKSTITRRRLELDDSIRPTVVPNKDTLELDKADEGIAAGTSEVASRLEDALENGKSLVSTVATDEVCSPSLETSLQFDCSESSKSRCETVVVPVKMNRCQYARLCSLRCKMPAAFTLGQWNLPGSSTSRNKVPAAEQSQGAGEASHRKSTGLEVKPSKRLENKALLAGHRLRSAMMRGAKVCLGLLAAVSAGNGGSGASFFLDVPDEVETDTDDYRSTSPCRFVVKKSECLMKNEGVSADSLKRSCARISRFVQLVGETAKSLQELENNDSKSLGGRKTSSCQQKVVNPPPWASLASVVEGYVCTTSPSMAERPSEQRMEREVRYNQSGRFLSDKEVEDLFSRQVSFSDIFTAAHRRIVRELSFTSRGLAANSSSLIYRESDSARSRGTLGLFCRCHRKATGTNLPSEAGSFFCGGVNCVEQSDDESWLDISMEDVDHLINEKRREDNFEATLRRELALDKEDLISQSRGRESDDAKSSSLDNKAKTSEGHLSVKDGDNNIGPDSTSDNAELKRLVRGLTDLLGGESDLGGIDPLKCSSSGGSIPPLSDETKSLLKNKLPADLHDLLEDFEGLLNEDISDDLTDNDNDDSSSGDSDSESDSPSSSSSRSSTSTISKPSKKAGQGGDSLNQLSAFSSLTNEGAESEDSHLEALSLISKRREMDVKYCEEGSSSSENEEEDLSDDVLVEGEDFGGDMGLLQGMGGGAIDALSVFGKSPCGGDLSGVRESGDTSRLERVSRKMADLMRSMDAELQDLQSQALVIRPPTSTTPLGHHPINKQPPFTTSRKADRGHSDSARTKVAKGRHVNLDDCSEGDALAIVGENVRRSQQQEMFMEPGPASLLLGALRN